MVITPRVFIVAIATGVFWLIALTAALFLVAGIMNSDRSLLFAGLAGAASCLFARHLFARNKQALMRWVRHRPE